MIPNFESRYEVVESTSHRLVFRQQYSTSDIQRQFFGAARVVPLIIVMVFFIGVFVAINLTFAFSFQGAFGLTIFPVVFPIILACLCILLAITRSKRFGLGMQVTTTLDKDRGTIEIDGRRLSRSGEVMASRFNRYKQFPLTATTMFTIEPVMVNRRRYQTNALYGLRLSCSSWLPIFVFQSTNVEIVTDLKRLLDGFLQGGGVTGTIPRAGMEPDRAGAGTDTLFQREDVPGSVAITRCPFCGSRTEPNGSFCPNCGAKLN